MAAIWSPGDGGWILKIFDEDYLPSTATPLIGFDFNGNFAPGTDNTLTVGRTDLRFNNGYFTNLTLGGVTISSWPSGGSSLWADAGDYVYPTTSTQFRVYDNTSGFYGLWFVPDVATSAVANLYHGSGTHAEICVGSTYSLYTSGGTYGIYASGSSYGGYFSGNVHVTGNLTVDGTYPGGGGSSYWTQAGNYVYPTSNSNVQIDYNGSNTYGIYVSKSSVASAPTNYFYMGGSADGTDYGTGLSAGIRAYRWYGDVYSAAIQGWSYGDYTRCGGTLGYCGSSWGSHGYKNSGSIYYGTYWTSSGSGTGRPAPPRGGKDSAYDPGGVHINIGAGGYGDLFGLHAQGQIYGAYFEGGRYGLYTYGDRFVNGLDVHLTDVGEEDMAVSFTTTSIEAKINTDGIGRLSAGSSRIEFDPEFKKLIDPANRVTVTVTPLGSCNGVYLSEVDENGFTVRENNGGESDVEFMWIAMARRVDSRDRAKLPREVIASDYTDKIARGLHNDADTRTDGEGLYFEDGDLVVGVHESLIPDPNFMALKEEFSNYPGKRSYSEWASMFGSYGKELGMSRAEFESNTAEASEVLFDQFGNQIPSEWVEELKADGVQMFTREQAEARRKQALIDNARALREAEEHGANILKEEEKSAAQRKSNLAPKTTTTK